MWGLAIVTIVEFQDARLPQAQCRRGAHALREESGDDADMLRKQPPGVWRHYFVPTQTAIIAPSLVIIRAWVAGRPRTRATHSRPLSIGTATWTVRTADVRQAVPDQWLSLD